MRRLGLAGVWSVVAFVVAAGCGGSGAPAGGGCRYDQWRGQCRLTDLRPSRVIERAPVSFVVVEATYEPVPRQGEATPPPFRQETTTPRDHEAALANHLRAFPVADCSVESPLGDPCAPRMAVSVPEFIPPAAAPSGPVGCEKIEAGADATGMPADLVLPGPVGFEEGSADLGADATARLDEVVALLARDRRIECVALRGQTAPGESFPVANERAQNVRRALEARGVEHARLTVFDASAPSHTALPGEQPERNEQRRVHLSIVVYGASPP